MKKVFLTIILPLSTNFLHIDISAMINSPTAETLSLEQKKFDLFMLNGNPRAGNMPINVKDQIDFITEFTKTPYPYRDNTEEEQKKRSKNILAQLINSEWASDHTERSQEYTDCFNDFTTSLIYKQILLRCLGSLKQVDTFKKTSETFRALETRIANVTQWLTAIRASGEEHYLFLQEFMYSVTTEEYNQYRTNTPKMRAKFWQFAAEEVPLADLYTSYTTEPANHYVHFLNSTSMAMIRHQVYKGFEGLEYKKTSEYTGPALCIIKIKGQEPCEWSYQELLDYIAAMKKKEDENFNLD